MDTTKNSSSAASCDHKNGERANTRGLVERMYEKRAEFAIDRAEYAQFRRGYRERLYEKLQFACEIEEAFNNDPDQRQRLLSDPFYECNRQKPDETTLLRHLLYFLSDAKTDDDREKWLKPTTVLEHLRSAGVPSHEIAQHLKQEGGYNRIYKALPGKRSAMSEPPDDLALLDDGQGRSADQKPHSLETADAEVDALFSRDADSDVTRPLPLAVRDGDCKVSEIGVPVEKGDKVASDSKSEEALNLQSGALKCETRHPARIDRTRVNLENTVPVVIPQPDPVSGRLPVTIELILMPRRGVLFYEVEPRQADGWREVRVVEVYTVAESSKWWPRLVDREGGRFVGGTGSPGPDSTGEHVSLAAEPIPIADQTNATAPNAQFNADEDREALAEAATRNDATSENLAQAAPVALGPHPRGRNICSPIIGASSRAHSATASAPLSSGNATANELLRQVSQVRERQRGPAVDRRVGKEDLPDLSVSPLSPPTNTKPIRRR